MSILVLPDPCLVVLVGAAGSGKSTLAARLFAPDEILSSDAMRAVVSGSEADQAVSAVAFRILHRSIERRLADGRLTVVDATNTTVEQRRPLLARGRAAAVPAVAIVLDLPVALVLAQNSARSARVVDPAVIDRHLASIRHTVDAGRLGAEGFDHVVLLRTPADVIGLRIDRRRLAPRTEVGGRPVTGARRAGGAGGPESAGGAGRRPAEGALGAQRRSDRRPGGAR
jgi:predicted kinase